MLFQLCSLFSKLTLAELYNVQQKHRPSKLRNLSAIFLHI